MRIVGYLPAYRMSGIDPEIGKYLTDLVYFCAEPGSDGELKLAKCKPEHLDQLKQIKRQHHTALYLCVGGWNQSAGFPELAASTAARRRFVAALTDYCLANEFDGVDLDWEHPANDVENNNYAALLMAIKHAFRPHHLQLTIAVAGSQTLPAATIKAVDRIHLMAYAAKGRHSTFELAAADVSRLLRQGVPRTKICLGVPFYGRGIHERSKVLPYSRIIQMFQLDPRDDEVDGVFFNGPATISRKAKFAVSKKLGGLMAWELGQDAAGEASLLQVMWRIVNGPVAHGPSP